MSNEPSSAMDVVDFTMGPVFAPEHSGQIRAMGVCKFASRRISVSNKKPQNFQLTHGISWCQVWIEK